MNKYLLTYLFQGGRSIQSYRARDFLSQCNALAMHRVNGRASKGSKTSGPWDKP